MRRPGGAAPAWPGRRLAPLLVWLPLLGAGCLHGRPAAPPPGAAEEGLASFYADRLQGRPTASGQPYDRAALTCAHRTAPFGARLRVTALGSGRSVVVTVNDSGPHLAGRVVDLSRAAAERLGLVEAGLLPVRVERVGGGG